MIRGFMFRSLDVSRLKVPQNKNSAGRRSADLVSRRPMFRGFNVSRTSGLQIKRSAGQCSAGSISADYVFRRRCLLVPRTWRGKGADLEAAVAAAEAAAVACGGGQASLWRSGAHGIWNEVVLTGPPPAGWNPRAGRLWQGLITVPFQHKGHVDVIASFCRKYNDDLFTQDSCRKSNLLVLIGA
jgi:hypothetical protein